MKENEEQMNRIMGEMKTIMENIEKGKLIFNRLLFIFKIKFIVGGDDNSRKRHLSKGKLLPRERLTKLLDDG